VTRVTRIQPGERIPIRLNRLHRSLILEHAFVSPELQGRIHAVSVEDGIVHLDLEAVPPRTPGHQQIVADLSDVGVPCQPRMKPLSPHAGHSQRVVPSRST
jgi:hypothetical protein